MNERPKRYGRAGRLLSAELRAFGLSNRAAARQLEIGHDTLRSWLAGWSAPRFGDEVYQRIRSVLGSEAGSRYERIVAQARLPQPAGSSRLQVADRLIDRGRLREAENQLGQVSDTEASHERAASYLHLGRAYFDQGDCKRAIECYTQAVELKRNGPESEEDLVEELGGRLTAVRAFADGHRILISELERTPSSWRLLRRLGILQWYDGALVQAYASLTTALSLEGPPARVCHARGQVLAELGQYEQALLDLREAIDDPVSEMSQSYARSCRAFIWHQLGDASGAEREFEQIAWLTPENAWHFYRWALCRETSEDPVRAADYLRRSLQLDAPPLVPRQIDDADQRLKRIMEP